MTILTHLLGGKPGQGAFNLLANDGPGLAGLPLLQRLAHADDRRQPAARAASTFLFTSWLGLLKNLPPLAVAEDDVLAADVLEHGGADFAGERAFRLVIAILSAQPVGRSLDGLNHRLPGRGWAGKWRHPHAEVPPTFAQPAAKATASARLRFIFQLPAMNFRRIGASL